MRCLLLLALAALALAQEPPRPKIAETFEAIPLHERWNELVSSGVMHRTVPNPPEMQKAVELRLHIMFLVRFHSREGDVNGTGRWYSDATNQKELETSELDGGKYRSYRLARFDLKKEYLIMGNDTDCEVHPLAEFHAPFSWIEEAHYEGKHTSPSGVELQVWALRHDEFSFTIGVLATDASKPYFFEREEGKTVVAMEFKSFLSEAPPATSFNVPAACNQRH